jgi:hypothetical protein
MTTITTVEQIPTAWDDTGDVRFFRITARVFTPSFCLGSSVLLASYDDDTVSGGQLTPPTPRDATTLDRSQPQPERDLVAVRVRRTR